MKSLVVHRMLHCLKLYELATVTAWPFNAGQENKKKTNWYFANGDHDHLIDMTD